MAKKIFQDWLKFSMILEEIQII